MWSWMRSTMLTSRRALGLAGERGWRNLKVHRELALVQKSTTQSPSPPVENFRPLLFPRVDSPPFLTFPAEEGKEDPPKDA